MKHKNINDHISSDQNELESPMLSSQRRRHIEDELESLERYKKNHPNDDHDPSHLELFCNEHPDALECRIYEE